MPKPDPKWKEKVTDWESSNKSAKEWSREKNIPYTTLLGWRKRLEKLRGNEVFAQSDANFIELKDSPLSDPGIAIEFQGFTIQLKRNFDKTTLQKCLDCLRGIEC